MKIHFSLLTLFLLVNSCRHSPAKPAPLKGELVFLLQYNNRFPTDVGFLTNHIIERRMANLMKENYEPFINEPKTETPLVVDSVTKVITAVFVSNNADKHLIEKVTVDVVNDALWVDYFKADTVLHYADRTSLKRPE